MIEHDGGLRTIYDDNVEMQMYLSARKVSGQRMSRVLFQRQLCSEAGKRNAGQTCVAGYYESSEGVWMKTEHGPKQIGAFMVASLSPE